MSKLHDLAPPHLLRIKDVVKRVGLGRSTIYALIKKGEFPPPRKFGSRVSLWDEILVSAWIERFLAEGRPEKQF